MALFNFLNARFVIWMIFGLALANFASFASAKDDDIFRPKSIPYGINQREALYREFTLVTEGPFNPSQAIRPSITQSVLAGGKNVTERFILGLEGIDHYETPFTTVTIIAEDKEKVAGILNQISSFYESYSTTEAISHYPLYTFIITIPIDSTDNASKTVTREEIEQLIFAKMKPNSLEHLLLDSNIFLAFTKTNLLFDKGKEQTQMDIWEVYSIKNRTFLRNLKEQWEAVDGRLFRKSKLLRRQDWEGVEVICSTFNTAVDEQGEIHGISRFELNVKRDRANGKFELKSGFSASILSDFEEALNFTRELLHPYEDYTDLTHFFEKYDNAFDLVVSHHGLNPERLKQIHHLAPTYFDGIWAYFVQPPVHTFGNIYVAPFAPSMWGMMALTWLVILFSFRLISWVRKSLFQPGPYWEKEEVEERERDEVVNQEAFWWAVAATCQQGWYVTPASTPVRGVFFTGLVFSLLCYAAYTATIVSELWDYVVPIRSLEGLLQNSQEVYLGEDSNIGTMIFQGVGQGGHGQKLLGKMKLTDVPTAFGKMVGEKRGKSCLLEWPEYVVEVAREKFTGNIAGGGEEGDSDSDAAGKTKNAEVNFCEQVRSFRYEYLPSKASMFVPKKSPFRETLNYRILVGVERGLFRRYWEEYRKNTRIRCLKESKKTYALGIYDTWIVFAVLLAGYGGSLVVLVVEIAYKRMKAVRAARKLK